MSTDPERTASVPVPQRGPRAIRPRVAELQALAEAQARLARALDDPPHVDRDRRLAIAQVIERSARVIRRELAAKPLAAPGEDLVTLAAQIDEQASALHAVALQTDRARLAVLQALGRTRLEVTCLKHPAARAAARVLLEVERALGDEAPPDVLERMSVAARPRGRGRPTTLAGRLFEQLVALVGERRQRGDSGASIADDVLRSIALVLAEPEIDPTRLETVDRESIIRRSPRAMVTEAFRALGHRSPKNLSNRTAKARSRATRTRLKNARTRGVT